jgi:hypothetical protein
MVLQLVSSQPVRSVFNPKEGEAERKREGHWSWHSTSLEDLSSFPGEEEAGGEVGWDNL